MGARRLAVALGVAGSAAVASAGTAQAAPQLLGGYDPVKTVEYVVAPAADVKLYPMADTGVDPLSNTVRTQIADFQPVGTDLVTGPLAGGASLAEVTGALGGLLGR